MQSFVRSAAAFDRQSCLRLNSLQRPSAGASQKLFAFDFCFASLLSQRLSRQRPQVIEIHDVKSTES